MKLKPVYLKLFVGYTLFLGITQVFVGCLSFRLTPEKAKAAFIGKEFQPKLKQIKLAERVINYAEIGASSLPTVVFIHGSPGSWSAFINFMKADTLLEKVRIISIDRPGFGYSGFGDAEESLQQQAAYLKPIIEAQRGNGKPLILVGHSLGGPTIARMAMDYPDLIDGLVFVAGSVAPELEPPRWYRYIFDAPPIHYLIPKSFQASNHEILHLKEELEQMLPLWKNIQQPCVVIQGEKDVLVAAANADFLKERLVNAEYLEIQKITAMNHFVPWSNPDLIVNSILSLIRVTKSR